ncbi:LEVG family PEP-CTERM protein [Halotia wernerae UHCC 0503]|nr:LEVG family PEP-CTERM protein [Halotia wernerae UHCC 0503]
MPRLKILSKLITVSTISISFLSITSAAHAANLIPQQEGEIKLTNLECLSNTNPQCIDTSSGKNGYTVTSLNYDPQFSASRLFVDKKDTANDYSAFGIQFLTQDAGTNPGLGEYWFRPVAYSAPTEKKDSPKSSTSKQTVDAPAGASIGTVTMTTPPKTETTTSSDGKKIVKNITIETTTVTKEIKVKGVTKLVQDITTKTITQTTTTPGKPVEKGALEVGKFKFDFKNPLTGLKLNFFDVEDSNYTGILSYTNGAGKTVSIQELLMGQKDGNLQSLMIHDVQSFVVQLGNPGKKYGYNDSHFSNTGDGVNLQLETVPEPGNIAGLGALAILGMIGRQQCKNKTA